MHLYTFVLGSFTVVYIIHRVQGIRKSKVNGTRIFRLLLLIKSQISAYCMLHRSKVIMSCLVSRLPSCSFVLVNFKMYFPNKLSKRAVRVRRLRVTLEIDFQEEIPGSSSRFPAWFHVCNLLQKTKIDCNHNMI